MLLSLCLVVCATSGCARWRFWSDDTATPESVVETQAADGPVETSLKKAVASFVQRESAGTRDQIQHRKPYYFRESVEYTGDTTGGEPVIQQTESRRTPYIADVQLEKIRYTTSLHKKRKAARDDTDFLREVGTEKVTFEYRGDRWQRVGSLFQVARVEKEIDGQWVEVKRELSRPVLGESQEDKGFFKRIWQSIAGY